jgi:hypothetical protein
MPLWVILFFYVPSNNIPHLKFFPEDTSVPTGKSWQLTRATNLGWCCLQGEKQLPVSLATAAAELCALISSTLEQAGNGPWLRKLLYPEHPLSPPDSRISVGPGWGPSTGTKPVIWLNRKLPSAGGRCAGRGLEVTQTFWAQKIRTKLIWGQEWEENLSLLELSPSVWGSAMLPTSASLTSPPSPSTILGKSTISICLGPRRFLRCWAFSS